MMIGRNVKSWKSWLLTGLVCAGVFPTGEASAVPLYGEPIARLPLFSSKSGSASLSDSVMEATYYATPENFVIPFMTPLEATIGRIQIGPDASIHSRISSPGVNDPIYKSSTTESRFGFYTPISNHGNKRYSVDLIEAIKIDRSAASKEGDPRFLPGGAYRPNYSLDTGIAFSYLLESAWFRLGISHVLDMGLEEGELPENSVSAALIMGYGFGKGRSERKPIHFTLGITSRYYYSYEYSQSESASAEYGTVFFAPGLQLSGSGVVFQAHVEVPIHQIRNGHGEIDPESMDPSVRDEMRANIGMKYYLE